MYYGKLVFWYSSHFYIGLVGIIVLIIHSQFSLGLGLSKIIMFVLFFTFLNGLYGIIMHFFIPDIFARQNIELNNLMEINKKKNQFNEKLHQLTKNKSEPFRKIYTVYVKKVIHKQKGVVSFFYSRFFNQEKLSNPMAFLAEKEKEIPEKERRDYRKLLVYYSKWRQLDNHLLLIRIMNNWLNHHISATTILAFLVGLHILSFYYY